MKYSGDVTKILREPFILTHPLYAKMDTIQHNSFPFQVIGMRLMFLTCIPNEVRSHTSFRPPVIMVTEIRGEIKSDLGLEYEV